MEFLDVKHMTQTERCTSFPFIVCSHNVLSLSLIYKQKLFVFIYLFFHTDITLVIRFEVDSGCVVIVAIFS